MELQKRRVQASEALKKPLWSSEDVVLYAPDGPGRQLGLHEGSRGLFGAAFLRQLLKTVNVFARWEGEKCEI